MFWLRSACSVHALSLPELQASKTFFTGRRVGRRRRLPVSNLCRLQRADEMTSWRYGAVFHPLFQIDPPQRVGQDGMIRRFLERALY